MEQIVQQTAQLLDTLKQYLKAKGVTYKTIANEMELSETSIKRLFHKKSFSMERLEAICRIVDLDLYDLVIMARKTRHQNDQKLTIEQERTLAANERLTIFFYFLMNGWSVSEIVANYEFSENQAQKHLIELDKTGLIELHPRNQFRILISGNIFWNREGPLWDAYKTAFANDLLDHPFDMPNHRLELCPGVLSGDSFRIILRKVDALVAQYNELAEMDAAIPLKNRYSTGLFICLRPWFYSGIAKLRRNQIHY